MQISFTGQNYKTNKYNCRQKANNHIIGTTALSAGVGTAAGIGLHKAAIIAVKNLASYTMKSYEEGVKIVKAEVAKAGSVDKYIANFAAKAPCFDVSFIKEGTESVLKDSANSGKFIKDGYDLLAKDIKKHGLVPAIAIGITGTFAVASMASNACKFGKAMFEKLTGKENQ